MEARFHILMWLLVCFVLVNKGQKTVIPNQVYQPLGLCPCDLTEDMCDPCCCCDVDCTPSLSSLFKSCCLQGPFGGNTSVSTDCHSHISFLCIVSPPENNPGLGLFYNGETKIPGSTLSFQSQQWERPLSDISYRRGSPIFTLAGEYFTIPQRSLNGQCVLNAPVIFLEDFLSECVRPSSGVSCPRLSTGLAVDIKDGYGGVVSVNVEDKFTSDPTPFVSWAKTKPTVNKKPEPHMLFCENVTLALNYTFYWNEDGLSSVTVVHTFGNVNFDPDSRLSLVTAATFENGDISVEPDSGISAYLPGKPVIGGVDGAAIQKASLNTWYEGKNGICTNDSIRPVVFGVNLTSGCMLPVHLDTFTNCSRLRDVVRALVSTLEIPTLVAKVGNPDFYSLADWINVVKLVKNSTTPTSPGILGACLDIPSEVHIVVYHTHGPQRVITAVQIQEKLTTWSWQCELGSSCQSLNSTQVFPLVSSITFSEELTYSFPPKTKFQTTFTEFDCARNDVCWPELLYPITRYYKSEPYSQSLMKGLALVFLILSASVLGSPWRQIRQAFNSSDL